MDVRTTTQAAHPRAGGAKVTRGGSAAGRGRSGPEVARQLGISEQTYYRWRNQFRGLKAHDVKRLRQLERENSTLKRLLAEAELEKAALKEIAKGEF